MPTPNSPAWTPATKSPVKYPPPAPGRTSVPTVLPTPGTGTPANTSHGRDMGAGAPASPAGPVFPTPKNTSRVK